MFNYQQLLQQEVEKYLLANFIYLQPAFEKFSDSTVSSKVYEKVDFTDLLDIEAPITEKIETISNFRPVKINYLEKEQNNRSLGEKGEQVALDYERWRLTKAGKRNYAGKVEWISKNLGDGTGFDIYSKNIDGSDRFIEVKTTKLIKETPIFLTSNELAFSKLKTSNFYLYRFFNFTTKPQFFIQQGSYERYCELIPQAFKGYFH